MSTRISSVRLDDHDKSLLTTLDAKNDSAAIRKAIRMAATVVAEVPEEAEPIHTEFGWTNAQYAPESKSMRELELYMAAGQAGVSLDVSVAAASPHIGKHILAAALERETMRTRELMERRTQDPSSRMLVSLDPQMLAMMQLAEFHVITEGDLWQTILSPLEVGFQDFDFAAGAAGDVAEARNYLEMLQVHERIEEIWLSMMTYGNTYALNVRDGKDIVDVLLPNPKHIAIDRQQGVGFRSFFYAPQNAEAIEALTKIDPLPSFIYNSTSAGWNETAVQIGALPLNPADVHHFHVPKFAHAIYGVPPLARATRAIDTRRYLEEMARSTIEGVRNQLWVFTLENPRRGEAKALAAQLAGTRGARTGYLVWGSNLKVQQFVPGSIDGLLANETFREKTLDILRRLGISIRMISGESPNKSGGADSESDVQVFLNRLLYSRKWIAKYLQGLCDEHLGKPGKVTLRMADVELAVANRIKNILVPLMNYGLPSPRTAFVMAGMDADTEMKQHAEDQDFREKHLMPYSGFAQNGPTGRAESPAGGRPAGRTETKPRQAPEKVQASVMGDYAAEIEGLWSDLAAAALSEQDVSAKEDRVRAFILALIATNATFRKSAYREGYAHGGGIHEIDENRVAEAAAWDYENAMRFQEELLNRIMSGVPIDGLHFRAQLYAAQGYKVAWMAGLWQAKQEQGYTAWQRILRPYASKTGPCQVCIDDAKLIHDIQEGWFDHPSGVCGLQFILFYKNATPGSAVRIITIESPGEVTVVPI